jgi:tetratricopeptide (TPR) repeat protein
MNKLSYLLTLVILTVALGIKAQAPTGTPESNYSIYKNKLKKSEEGLADPKKNITPKYWIARAELLMDIFDMNRKFIGQGTPETSVNLFYLNPKDTKEWQGEDGSLYKEIVFERITIRLKNGAVENFVETDILYENPLPEALKCLEKAQELDVEGKSAKDLKEDYITLKKHYERLGIEEFFKPDYKESFTAFSKIADINEKPLMGGVIDTTLLYYAGMAASRASMTQESITFYEKARSSNYPLAELYVFLKDKYFSIGDTAKGEEVLKEGFTRFPESQQIVIELINYYLLSGHAEEALNYLQIAQQGDPGNLSFLFAEGTLYDKMGDTEKALATYNKCIEKDPNYFNAYYNLGVMYYNKAVEMFKAADGIKNPKEYGAAKDAADAELAKSLPYMEKANDVADANTDWAEAEKAANIKATLETLKTLYLRLMQTEKYQAVIEELNQFSSSPTDVNTPN